MNKAALSLFTGTEAGFAAVQQPGSAGASRWLIFRQPVETLTGFRPEDVLPCLRRIEEAAVRGLHSAGFLCYEAAPAFDQAFASAPPDGMPLFWFGLYHAPAVYEFQPPSIADIHTKPVFSGTPEVGLADYHRQIGKIKEYIGAGDCYQVNCTCRFRGMPCDDIDGFFVRIAGHSTGISLDSQKPCGGYAAFIRINTHTVYSATPELFFSLNDDEIICKPMKGTAPRGRFAEEDRLLADSLRTSEKNRAENIMIVDMVRNDLGRICKPGSIRADPLFTIEKYPSVFQMTSTVSGRTQAGLSEIFRALFPAASITGAPKIRATEIIRELESSPRGLYTGAIGYVSPGRRAQFSVAIRTMTHDHRSNRISYGSGGGVVWDSTADDEHREIVIKTGWMQPLAEEPFQLLETMRWHPQSGFFLLKEHLDRMELSAQYFGFAFERADIAASLRRTAEGLSGIAHRIRLRLNADGTFHVESFKMDAPANNKPWKVCLAHSPVIRADAFLFNKTTNRRLYDDLMAQHPGMDDVVLWNANGDITESCRANVIVRKDGRWITPPLEAGLLNGTYREHLLRRKIIHEGQLTPEDFLRSGERYLINSLRRRIAIELC
ncbi:MAG: chorismate-binding protein [Kiritimatiellia bacterium]